MTSLGLGRQLPLAVAADLCSIGVELKGSQPQLHHLHGNLPGKVESGLAKPVAMARTIGNEFVKVLKN